VDYIVGLTIEEAINKCSCKHVQVSVFWGQHIAASDSAGLTGVPAGTLHCQLPPRSSIAYIHLGHAGLPYQVVNGAGGWMKMIVEAADCRLYSMWSW